MNPLQLGPFMLKTEVLTFGLSVLAGYIGLRLRLNRSDTDHSDQAKVKDKLVNGFLMWLIIWKLSLVLFDPVSVTMSPQALLYFDGGEKGLWLGGIASGLYVGYSIMKSRISVAAWVDYVSISWFCGSAAYHLLMLLNGFHEGIYHLASSFITILLAGMLFKRQKRGELPYLLQILLWFCIGQILSLFLNEGRTILIMGFSMSQLLYLVFSCMLLALAHKTEHKRKAG
ncbi:hypothetical protein P5G65_31525 [Paenibacillus chondroitinus]|uniref:Diacylglyceryl transferase n=1 Tax=Paenibacillus chondroitinus TaxID=59842 RepID=A0ABU6DKZ0_9BACL|nr:MULTISPECIES: hypothetical protein [Paenibacillus]MCY9657164.1 hypothetical protein [Paenibacillus anseongense]MEB4798447.1 hypothetical protein [Paenibacillus chondroitinus]